MAPIMSLGYGVIVAIVVAVAVRFVPIPSRIIPNGALAGLIAVTLGTGALMARDARADYEQRVAEREFAQRPRVILESDRVVKTDGPPNDGVVREGAQLVAESLSDDAHPAIDWNGRTVRLHAGHSVVRVLDAEGEVTASSDLAEFDYVVRVQASPFCPDLDGRRALAVYVHLRGTGGRSMFVVYAPDGTTEYQEHLELTAGPGGHGLYADREAESESVMVGHGAVVTYTCRLDGRWDWDEGTGVRR